MPSPRRRYSRLPVGFVEALPAPITADSKPSPLLLLLWLYVSPLRRSLPGVIRAGEATLADALGWSIRMLRVCLKTLEDADLVRVCACAGLEGVFSGARTEAARSRAVITRRAREA